MSNKKIDNKATRNKSLDVLKLIASYMVVFIHFTFYGRIGGIIDALARFAVPVFFMSSGYFSYMNSTDKLQKKVMHIIKIYLCGFFLHFLFYFMLNLYSKGIEETITYLKSYVEIKTWFYFLVFNCSKAAIHLWFLCALIYVYIIQYFVIKLNIGEKIYIGIAICLLIIHLILGVGLSAIGIVIPNHIVRNFLLMGYPFFCLGLILKKNETVILEKISYRSVIFALLFGGTETIVSRIICGKNELYFGSILIALSLFIIALKMRDKSYNFKINKLLETSTIIYLIHIIIGKCLNTLFPCDIVLWRFISPVIVCILSTIIALICNMILNKIKTYVKRFV